MQMAPQFGERVGQGGSNFFDLKLSTRFAHLLSFASLLLQFIVTLFSGVGTATALFY